MSQTARRSAIVGQLKAPWRFDDIRMFAWKQGYSFEPCRSRIVPKGASILAEKFRVDEGKQTVSITITDSEHIAID